MRETDRFYCYVNRTESCWLWTGGRSAGGYGRFWLNGANIYAHRYSYIMENGEIGPSMKVLHRCDTPSCVRPDHLFLGTNRDNTADMIAKGRKVQPRGEGHGMARLTEDQVRGIRGESGLSQREIAAKYGVSQPLVSAIRTGKLWAHV